VWSLYGDEHGGDWVGAIFDDNTVWRGNLKTGASDTIPPAMDRFMVLRKNGDAVVSDVDLVQLWRTDGTHVDIDAGPAPHGKVVYVDDSHMLVLARAETGYLIDLDTLTSRQVYPPGAHLNDLRYEGRLGIFVGGDDSIHLTDAFTGEDWVTARPTERGLGGCLVARDHSAAYAVAGDTLLVWPLPVIETREQTLQFIEDLIE
jgi:hypothetical protein